MKFSDDTLFDVEIKTPEIHHQVSCVSYKTALSLCEDVLKNNPNDKELQQRLKSCMECFGIMSYSGECSIRISAYRKTIKTGEMHTCPRRMSDYGPWQREENLDEWNIIGDDRCCSFCGSLHPDRVIELVEQHGFAIINGSDKCYKWYIHQPNVPNAGFGGIKYYRHHDTEEFIKKLNELKISECKE